MTSRPQAGHPLPLVTSQRASTFGNCGVCQCVPKNKRHQHEDGRISKRWPFKYLQATTFIIDDRNVASRFFQCKQKISTFFVHKCREKDRNTQVMYKYMKNQLKDTKQVFVLPASEKKHPALKTAGH